MRRGQKLVAFSGVIVAVERTRTGSRLADETPHPRRAYTCATRFADLHREPLRNREGEAPAEPGTEARVHVRLGGSLSPDM
jgi:hypothetical protein